jgi:glycosyltransferase involved in cell wall biosynthesis
MMPHKSPLVTVGMPVYNGARTLRHALDSIQAQSLTDIEIVISDNASTDATADIIAEYAARDHRIRSYRNPDNLGARYNYNRVLELARGTYFKWASHDDWIASDYLERCVQAMEDDPQVILCYSAMCRVDAQSDTRRIVFPAHPLARSTSAVGRMHDVLWSVPYYPIFGLFRTSALRSVHGIPNCPEPDRVTLARAALQGTFAQIPDVLFFQRSSEKNTPNRNVWRWLDPANRSRRRLRIVRVAGEICGTVNRSGLPLRERSWIIGDTCVSLTAKTLRGKVRQLRRRYGVGYAQGPKIVDTFTADWEQRSAQEAQAAIAGLSGRTVQLDQD